MNVELENFLSKLHRGAISGEEFLKQYESTEKIKVDDNYCLRKLNEGYVEKDSKTIEVVMIIGNVNHVFSERFSDIFCKLLLVSWHRNHEDIAVALKQLKNPAAIECLYEAAELRFDYLDYDDTFQFARKCIKALSAIDTESAISKLRNLAESQNTRIKEYAEKELNYKGLM